MKSLKNIVVVLMVLLFGNTASAQNLKNEKTPTPFIVNFIGTQDDYLLFQVKITSEYNNLSVFNIVDNEEGN